MRRLRVESEKGVRTFPLPSAGELHLGAARDNDIILPVAGVSRRHARLRLDGDGAHLVDLGSKNRLIVDGERQDEVFLAPGRSVQIGNALVTLEEVATSDGELAFAMDDSSSVAVVSGGDTGDVESRPNPRSPRSALGLVRRYESVQLTGEVRHRFLEDVRRLLGATTLMRFHVAPERPGADGLVVEEVAGPLPALDVCAELTRLEPAHAPRTARLESGPPCLWLGSDPSSVLAALGETASDGGEPSLWVADFLAYVAERIERQEPEIEAETARAPRDGELDVPPGMVLGSSQAMRNLVAEIRASLESRNDVLLYGETGTGKELFARLLHRSSPRSEGPFVAINCAAIPAELLEAELFGVEKRVATGVDPRPGLFRQAEGGTLLLDEIADLPAPLQAKLLRALQEREVLPLGASRPVKVDLRVISTSNCDLRRRVDEGAFRSDLYYRLDRLRFTIPPLRERLEDLPVLARTFASRAAAEHGYRIRGLSVRALRILEAHRWPGNVRELEATVERAVVRCRAGVLESEHFNDLTAPEGTNDCVEPRREPGEPRPRTLKDRLEAEERRALREALAATRGNRSQAARRLEISRQGLIDKLRRLGLDGGHEI